MMTPKRNAQHASLMYNYTHIHYHLTDPALANKRGKNKRTLERKNNENIPNYAISAPHTPIQPKIGTHQDDETTQTRIDDMRNRHLKLSAQTRRRGLANEHEPSQAFGIPCLLTLTG